LPISVGLQVKLGSNIDMHSHAGAMGTRKNLYSYEVPLLTSGGALGVI